MFQTKEQDKTPEEKVSDMEIGNLPDKEFIVMIVKMIQDLRKRIDAQSKKIQEFLNKELKNINNQTDLKNKITGMKTVVEGINSRINETEEWLSELDRMVEITGMEQNQVKRMWSSHLGSAVNKPD